MKPKFALRHFLPAVAILALATSASNAATLHWDANDVTAGQTDGAGGWLDTDHWWTGTTNTSWTDGDDAIFGWGGAGGAVTLAAGPITVNSLTFKYFTGTYTLGTAGQAITLNNGITKIGGQVGAVTINSPLILGGAQTWTNNSTGAISLGGATTLNGNLTIDGDGIVNSVATAAAIGGTGDIIKNGTGQFNFSAGGTPPTHTFTGDIVVNGGSIGFQNSSVLSGRNVHLTDGYLGGRFGSGFTWSGGLGEGANQIRITGGTSGLSGEGNSSSNFQIGGALSTLIWGANGEGSATGYFNPDVLLLNGNHRMNSNGVGSLNNVIDLNGDDRTITSTQITNGASNSGFTVSGAIINGDGVNAAGLTKTGPGNLILAANNTYDGATTIRSDNAYSGSAPYLVTTPGSITLSGANGRISNTSALNLTSGGTLRMVSTNAQNTVDRINSAAITVTGGGGLWWENTAGANSFAETVGTVTVDSGLFNINLTTNQTGAGSQTITLGTLTRNGTSSLAFSAGVTGPQTSGNKNMIVVSGAGTTGAGQIIGAWATTGTAPAVQTDYAIYSSDYVTSLGATANNDETTWASTDNINFNTATTLTATRTVNTLRYSGAAANLDLGSNNLETTGLLNGGTGLLTLSGTGALTTPTGGGSLYATTGSNVVTIANPITDNSGVVTLVKSGTAAVTTDNGNIDTQGTLVLNGVNTYTGNTIINGGTLRIGTNGASNGAVLGSGNYAGNIEINGGGLLYISTNAAQTLSGVISGDGALLKSHNGILTLSGANTYTGKTSIAPSTTGGAGTLEVSSFNSVNGGTPLMANSSLGAPTTVANGTIDLGGPGNVQGGAVLRYIGTGETTDRVINVQMGANTSRTIDASGSGLLKFTSAFTSIGGTVATTTLQLIGTGNGEIVQGLPFAHLNLTKNGTGTWTLGGAVETSGILNVSGGTLALQQKAGLMGGVETYWTAPKVIVNSGGTLALNVGGTDQFSGTDVTTILTRLGGLGGAVNNNGLRAGSTIGFDTTNATGGTFTLADDMANSTGTGGGAIGLTKLGAGVLELTGTNSNSGATRVLAGTLLVNGSTAAGSAVSVASGATLAGNGEVAGTINVTGSIAPGDSDISTLLAGSTTWNGAATASAATDWKFELGTGDTADLLDITGDFTKNDSPGSIFRFDFLGSAFAGTFDLVSWTGTTNFDGSEFSFTGLDPLYTGSFGISGSTLQFTSSVIPEPSTALAGILLGLGLLRRRRQG